MAKTTLFVTALDNPSLNTIDPQNNGKAVCKNPTNGLVVEGLGDAVTSGPKQASARRASFAVKNTDHDTTSSLDKNQNLARHS